METDILLSPLHSLQVSDLDEVRRVADTMLSRLTLPFRQSRTEWEFSFPETLRSAFRRGDFLPTYKRVSRSQPKSRVVIAMSLSGIDRCYAVGLIPLLSELKKFLNFKLFIYSDRVRPAEFSDDGYLANDHELAWNHVLAPVVFAELSSFDFERQEDTLLIVDSLGGGDSEWYESWSPHLSAQARDTQLSFCGYGAWRDVREWLNGKYERFPLCPASKLPAAWESKLIENSKYRWVETPAMKEYLIRYIFNPRFGTFHHGEYPQNLMRSLSKDRYLISVRAVDSLQLLRDKFRNIHVLSPAPTLVGEDRFKNVFLDNGLADFHHETDTLEGFGKMLVNIVYGRETNRLTTPKIRFGTYIGYGDGGEDDSKEDTRTSHSELTKTFNNCFAGCEIPMRALPRRTTFDFIKRNLERTRTLPDPVPYNEIDLELSTRMPKIMSLFPKWKCESSWSAYSQLAVAKEVFDYIKKWNVSMAESDLQLVSRPKTEEIILDAEYAKFHTRVLRKDVQDAANLVSNVYTSQLLDMPLKSVVWCTVGKFKRSLLAISACPSDDDDKRRTIVFHEMGHWIEHCCPAIGTFTNNLLHYLTGEVNLQKLVPVGVGEFAMPISAWRTPWIIDYAGKWYRRHHSELPNPTEILSVHMEYFRSPESLVQLICHDERMVKLIAFIMMGGPEAILHTIYSLKRRRAMREIDQRARNAQMIEERKGRPRGRPSGSGKKSERPSDPLPNPAIFIEEEPKGRNKSFGI